MHQLAIIIPAYKSRFLKKALESLSSQTCKDFSVYIGDDASKENIEGITNQFRDKLDIVYHKFENNIGGVSLTKQWERCIDLSKLEPYIWLFSDDDEISPDAVNSFYMELKENPLYDVYRFKLSVINDKSFVINKFHDFPLEQSDKDFFFSRISDNIYSCITQYIISRKAYTKNNGFTEFPLAWSSDDASIMVFAKETGIRTISNGQLYWRLVDGSNITSTSKYEKERSKAEFQYALWFNNYFKGKLEVKTLKNYSAVYFKKRLEKLPLKFILTKPCLSSAFHILGLKATIMLFKISLLKIFKVS